jgi:Glycosyl hydrolase family 3 N terminal domain
MKTRLLLNCRCFGTFVLAAETTIYHNGWIDLNKNGKMDIFEDPSQPVAKRVHDLLEWMMLDEKIGQLWQEQMEGDSDVKFADKLKHGEVNSFLDGSVLIETPVMRNKIQRIAVEQSRLGIPLIFANDVIHGFRTLFPIPLAQACAWEPELFEQTDTLPRAKRRRAVAQISISPARSWEPCNWACSASGTAATSWSGTARK